MLYIRVDANPHIATGHLMRCISIANEFRSRGEDTTFIIADMYPCEFLKRENFRYLCLNTKWDQLDIELDQMIDIIKDKQISKLLIDSYYVTEQYLRKLGSYTKTIYIDDLAKFIYPVHMLINYNIYSDLMKYEEKYVKKQTKLLLGMKYTPLRKEFMNISHEIRTEVKRIFITTGGSDSHNTAGKLLDYLHHNVTYTNDLVFHVIVGKFNMNKEYLEQLSIKYPNIILHYDVTNMSVIMIQCDIAVTAGGTTMYELCACAIPMITYSIVDNQIDGVKGFERLGIAKYCGDVRDSEQDLFNKINEVVYVYIQNRKIRIEVSEKMLSLVDGKGTSRLYEEITGL